MKKQKRIFTLLTLISGILAAIAVCAAVFMRIKVSGDNLLSMNSNLGYFLAVSYRWAGLAAAVLVIVFAALLAACVIKRRKKKKKSDFFQSVDKPKI